MATLVFKATESCNANCVYCDVVHLRKPATISLSLLATVYRRIDEYLKANPREEVHIVWHGGEPCMAGLHFYEEALRLSGELCADTRSRISYSVQSNLTMITDAFLDVFGRMGMTGIGTSYEAQPGVRGIGAARDSELYNRRFFEGINLLEKRGFSWGFIYVVTRAVLARPVEIFYHLANVLPSGNFTFHVVVSSEKSAEESRGMLVSQEEYADFLGAVFMEWWPRRHRFPHVEPFATLLRQYMGESGPTLCSDSVDCGRHLYIGPDGETSQCGRSADWGILRYGNIAEHSLDELYALPQRREVDGRSTLLADGDCKGCEYWRICHGGCPLDAYNGYGDFRRKSDQCDSRRIFLRKYFEPVTGLRMPGMS